MDKRVRVTLSFVVSADVFPSMRPLLDGFEGAACGLWPGIEGEIEPGGRLKLQQMPVKGKLAPRKVAKAINVKRSADGSRRSIRSGR